MANEKPILCLDFDGVLHAYTSGWQGGDQINDGPVPGAMAWLREAVEHFDVQVFSSRSRVRDWEDLMKFTIRDWLVEEHGEVVGRIVYSLIRFPRDKPSAFVSLDDRALTFTGVFPSFEELLAFKPWTHKEEERRE